jgi:hypothetical protein
MTTICAIGEVYDPGEYANAFILDGTGAVVPPPQAEKHNGVAHNQRT